MKTPVARNNIINWLFTIVVIFLLVNPTAKGALIRGLIYVGFFKPHTPAITEKPLAPLFNIAISDSTGKTLNTADFRGKAVFINFWATWCPPCIGEMPSVNELYLQYKNSPNVVFVMIDVDGNVVKAKAFMQKHQYRLPVYTLAGQVPQSVIDGTIPTTLVFNKKGELVYKHTNAANYNNDDFSNYLTELSKQ